MKRSILITGLVITLVLTGYSQESMSSRMAESVMHTYKNRQAGWNYEYGTILKAMELLWQFTGEQKYYDFIKQNIDQVVDDKGKIRHYSSRSYNIDNINEGRMLLFMYQETGEEKYRIAADSIRDQLAHHPRTSGGGFWHKKVYPQQIWLDGLYMGSPFYAEYADLFDKPSDFDDVTRQFLLVRKHLRDAATGLYYHAWDESGEMFWSNPVTCTSRCFWGRGMGWLSMALVDVLDVLPEDHEDREVLLEMLNNLAESLVRYQDPATGLWYQVIDQGGRYGNYHEASASCMFVYALAKSVKNGWIEDSYYVSARKGYDGIKEKLLFEDLNGYLNLSRICRSAGLGPTQDMLKVRDGSFEYYVFAEPIVTNDPKGTGPFIMASVIMESMESGNKTDK